MSLTRPDLFPSYRQVISPLLSQPQAGLRIDARDQSTAVCLQPQQRDILTPFEQNKFRKSYRQQPGVTIRHYGTVNDPLPPTQFAFGVKTEKSEGVGQILTAGHREGVGEVLAAMKESKYKSLQREPLARTVNRQYQLPTDCKQPEFQYGLPTNKDKYDAKESIFSGINMPEPEQIREMYLKSHQDFDPGEQKKRPYNWNVDPTDFRFGKVEKNPVHDQMKQCIAPEANSDAFPQTKFVTTNQQNFIDRKKDKLGLPANLGQKEFPADHVFGVRIEPSEWDAGRCLKGDPTSVDVRPDDDLGHTNKHGFRNVSRPGDENRSFGVPSVRYDIVKPARPSVADPNNYADQKPAIQLLFPQRFSDLGVDSSDFDQVRPKQQIRSIFQSIGVRFKGNIFEAVFERSKAIQGTILDRVSCNAFKASVREMCA